MNFCLQWYNVTSFIWNSFHSAKEFTILGVSNGCVSLKAFNIKHSLDTTKVAKQIWQNLCKLKARGFHCLGPLGRVSLVVAISFRTLSLVFHHYWKRAYDSTRLILQDFKLYQNIGKNKVFQLKWHENLIQYCLVVDFR